MNTKSFKTAVLIAIFSLATLVSHSQIDQIGYLLAGGVNDAELMMTEYIRPLANSLGANLNGGWYNTAKPHKIGGFDITFTTSLGFAPKEHRTYDLSTLDLDATIDPTDNIAKTIAGTKGGGPTIRYMANLPAPMGLREIVSYDHPGGTGIAWAPSPMINASLGLIKGTEVMGRYMPNFKYGQAKNNTIGLWGIGGKHDIGQWIPFVKRVPVLNIAVMYGYTKLDFHTSLTPVTPEMLSVAPGNDLTTLADWNTQDMDMQFKSHTANLLISANLPVVSFYGGVGFSSSKVNLKLNGDFPIPTIISDPLDPDFGEVVVTDASMVTDPFDIEISNQDGGTTKPRLNAGIRFKFAVITLHFDYTKANYSVATAGLGISVR